jgi:hypothetical protein
LTRRYVTARCSTRFLCFVDRENYAQIKKECLAILFACERFHQYLWGLRNIEVESDHKPLEDIFRKPICDAPMRLQRMLLSLQKYNVNLSYKKVKLMYIADILSRTTTKEISEDQHNNHLFREI